MRCWPEPRFPNGITRQRLLSEATTVVCSPKYARAKGFDRPDKLGKADLQHSSADYADWSTWSGRFGGPDFNVARGQVFPNRDLAYRAAMMGAGVAIGDLTLLGEELGSGALMVPFPDCIFRSPDHDYFIVVREGHAEEPRIAAFTRWLIEERDATEPGLQAA